MNNFAKLPARHLDVTNLSCTRGEHQIFADRSFALAPGEALLLTGPNGAGKTSLLLCLAGFLFVPKGQIDWQGRDPEQQLGEDIHFIGHQSAVKPGLTVAESLMFWAKINGGAPNEVHPALEQAGLGHATDLDASLLSAGQVRRLALARLIVSPRPIWLLDEPTSALDKDGDKWVTGLIDAHLDSGGIAIAATHLDLSLKNKKRLKTLKLGGGK